MLSSIILNALQAARNALADGNKGILVTGTHDELNFVIVGAGRTEGTNGIHVGSIAKTVDDAADLLETFLTDDFLRLQFA